MSLSSFSCIDCYLFDGKWERPSVHRVLELLYRTVPLVQLGSAICEVIFEKFHHQAKREVEQSSNRNLAEYAMQRRREIETLSRALSMLADLSIPPSWLLGQNGKPLKSVVFHQRTPQKRYTAATFNTWSPRRCRQWRGRRRRHPHHPSPGAADAASRIGSVRGQRGTLAPRSDCGTPRSRSSRRNHTS